MGKSYIKEKINVMLSHTIMLGKVNVITKEEASHIVGALQKILFEINRGTVGEDIELKSELEKKNPELYKKAYTATGEPEIAATAKRLFFLRGLKKTADEVLSLIERLCSFSDVEGTVFFEGQDYPANYVVSAFALGLIRDYVRLLGVYSRTDCLSVCDKKGTAYPVDFNEECSLLGFTRLPLNNLDCVTDDDYAAESVLILEGIALRFNTFAFLFNIGEDKADCSGDDGEKFEFLKQTVLKKTEEFKEVKSLDVSDKKLSYDPKLFLFVLGAAGAKQSFDEIRQFIKKIKEKV